MKSNILRFAVAVLLGYANAEEACVEPLELSTVNEPSEITELDPFAFTEEEEVAEFEEPDYEGEGSERRLKLVTYYTTAKKVTTTTVKKTYVKPPTTTYVYVPTVYKPTTLYIPTISLPKVYIPPVYIPTPTIYVAATSYYKPTIITKLNIGQTCSSNVGCLSGCCKADTYGWKMCQSLSSCTVTTLISSGSSYIAAGYNTAISVVKVRGTGSAAGAGGGGLLCLIILIWLCCRSKPAEGVVVAVHHPGEKVEEVVTTTVVEEVVEAHTYDDGLPEPGFQMIPGGQPIGMPYQPPPPYGMPMQPGMMGPPGGMMGPPGGMMGPPMGHPGGMMGPPGGMMQPGMQPGMPHY